MAKLASLAGPIYKNLKALPNGLVVGTAVLYSPGGEPKDLSGQYFESDTDYGWQGLEPRAGLYHHGLDARIGDREIGSGWKRASKKDLEDWEMDPGFEDLGMWVYSQLDLRNKYEYAIYKLGEAGKLGLSSATAEHMIKALDSGKITRWHIVEVSWSPIPMDYRTVVSPLKDLPESHLDELLKDLPNTFIFEGVSIPQPPDPKPEEGGQRTSSQKALVPTSTRRSPVVIPIHKENTKAMDLMTVIKQLVPDLTDEQASAIASILQLAGVGGPESSELDNQGVPGAPAPGMMGLDEKKLGELLTKMGFQPTPGGTKAATTTPGSETAPQTNTNPTPAQGGDEPTTVRPPYQFTEGGAMGAAASNPGQKAMEATYVTRFKEESSAERAIFEGAIDPNYRQLILDQSRAFQKAIRWGDSRLDNQERKLLDHQIYPLDYILHMVKEGMSVAELKTAMVEAQGSLGGWAVPPTTQANIQTRLPGRTVMRGGGATVVTLASGNAVDIPYYAGGDKQYVGALRGLWGTELTKPSEINASLEQITVVAHIYTYKIRLSQTMVEDASNLISIIENDIVDTLAIDEDNTFLTGDGVGKPLGALPGGANLLGLTEVKTGDAALLTVAGLRKLKRGLPSQYRKNGRFIGASDTFGAVEAFVATTGQFIFPDLSETSILLSQPTSESEAMPAVAAGTFPLLFADLSGYWIVERMGLTIARFQDSGTGINQVEYQVRRRLGGHISKSWLFAVQKVSA